MWYELRDFKKRGFHFRKQAPIGNYIVDFVCLKHKLIIELDGGHHSEDAQHTHDENRDAWLKSEGYKVLRFWNKDFFKNRQDVLNTILDALPLKGGGGDTDAGSVDGGGDTSHKHKRLEQ